MNVWVTQPTGRVGRFMARHIMRGIASQDQCSDSSSSSSESQGKKPPEKKKRRKEIHGDKGNHYDEKS